MNPYLIAAIIVCVAIALVLVAFKGKEKKQTSVAADVYFVNKSLFTPAERSFLGVLESIDYEGVTIASKVRLADVFGTKKGLTRGERQSAFNRINAKHVDFLLLQKTDARPLLGIELDDSSHKDPDRVARDIFVDRVFESTGLPILHVGVKVAYDPREIHRQIEDALSRSDPSTA